MSATWEHKTGQVRAGRQEQPSELPASTPGRREETAHRLAEATPDGTRADERARAARSISCPCQAEPGVPCSPPGDHLARYLHAEQSGAITRESLKEAITGLDVIASQVIIQPPGERAAHATGTQTADQVDRAQMEAGVSPDRIEASAESVLGGRFDHSPRTPRPSTAATTKSPPPTPAKHGNWSRRSTTRTSD